MPYEIARYAGFCSGVRSAMEKAEAAASAAREQGIPCVMLGELIHNQAALEPLLRLGVRVIRTVDEAPRGAVILLRSHGEPPETYEECARRNLTVVDTTCAFVSALHELIREQAQKGLPILLMGDQEHPETRASAGYGKGRVFVVSDEKDLAALPPLTKPLIVAQTTYPPQKWAETQPTLTKLFPDL